MRRALLVSLLFLGSIGYAGQGHRHTRNGDCCNIPDPIPGPRGEKGDSIVGPAGESIVGASGVDGKDGRNGRDGSDANADNRLAVNVGAEVRWYDWKHVSLNSGYRRDLWHGGNTVDALIVQIKLGKSYEAREMEKLRADLKAAMINLEKNDEILANAVNGIAAGSASNEVPAKGVIRGSR